MERERVEDVMCVSLVSDSLSRLSSVKGEETRKGKHKHLYKMSRGSTRVLGVLVVEKGAVLSSNGNKKLHELHELHKAGKGTQMAH